MASVVSPIGRLPGCLRTTAFRYYGEVSSRQHAGFGPAELELVHERAALSAALQTCSVESERVEVRRRLSDLEQNIALRLETLRIQGAP